MEFGQRCLSDHGFEAIVLSLEGSLVGSTEENYSPSLRSHRQLIVHQERARHHESLPCPRPVVTMPIPVQVALIASAISCSEVGDLPFSLSSGSYILSVSLLQ